MADSPSGLRPMRPIARHPFVEDTLPVEGPPDAPKPPRKAPHKPATWSVEQLKKDLAACDGGTGVYAKAKAANGGRDPVFQVGRSAIGSGGEADPDTGVITMDPGQDRATAAESAIVELTNLSNKVQQSKVDAKVAAGKLSREQYTRAREAIEFGAVRNAIQADRACKHRWGAPPGWTGSYDSFANVKKFDEYYKYHLATVHKNYYRNAWDSNYKAIYEAAHPPHKHP